MTDEETLEALNEAYKEQWHIWHDPARGWCALPKHPPFGDPVIAANPVELTEKLEAGRADQSSL